MDIIRHSFPPLYQKNSETLILGSFPSVRFRESMFFYGHRPVYGGSIMTGKKNVSGEVRLSKTEPLHAEARRAF